MEFVLELLFATIAVVVLPVFFLLRYGPDVRYLNRAKAVGPTYWGAYASSKGSDDSDQKFELQAPPPQKDVVMGSRSYAQGKGVRRLRNFSMK
jgi:hypothetical protein